MGVIEFIPKGGLTPIFGIKLSPSFSMACEYLKEIEAETLIKKVLNINENRAISLKEVEDRLVKLGITKKEVLDYLGYFSDSSLSKYTLDNYIKKKEEEKEEQKKAIEFEQKAKIKTGMQYICTDGYDKWILKFNGNRATFGELNLFKGRFTYYYYRNESDNDPIFVNRLEGTVNFGGNLLKCRLR